MTLGPLFVEWVKRVQTISEDVDFVEMHGMIIAHMEKQSSCLTVAHDFRFYPVEECS